MAAIPALPSAPEEKHPHASHNGNLRSCNEPQEKLDDIIQAYKANSNKLTKEIICHFSKDRALWTPADRIRNSEVFIILKGVVFCCAASSYTLHSQHCHKRRYSSPLSKILCCSLSLWCHLLLSVYASVKAIENPNDFKISRKQFSCVVGLSICT